jgi:twinkle protein
VITEDFVTAEMKEVVSSTFSDIRGIDPEVCKMFGIQMQLDATGKPVRYAYKYPHNTKYRDANDKSKTWMKEKGLKMNKLFGPDFNAGSATRIYITEGEFDAASLYQVLGKTYPVKSLPSASISDDFIKENHTYLNSFKEIVYAGEQDKAGKKAADRMYKAFPEKFFYVPMTKWKDANEFLQKGDGDDLKWAAVKPQRWTPENFFCSDSQIETILREENPYQYTPTGHTGLDEVIRGLVKGGLTFLKAPPGSGKTELFRFMEMGLLKNNPECKIGLLHMEEMKSFTYRAMATYHLGINVRTEDDAKANGISEDDVVKAAKDAARQDRTIVFEMKSGDDPMAVLDYCNLASRIYGADYIFIDHVQRLAYLGGVEGATNTLTKLAANLAQLAKELNVGIIMISHVNDDGHTKYAKSLEEEAIICIRIERDKEAKDEESRNTTRFFIEKNRPFSKLGLAGAVYYDPETTLLSEVEV